MKYYFGIVKAFFHILKNRNHHIGTWDTNGKPHEVFCCECRLSFFSERGRRMSEADKIFMGIFLIISHIGFFFWGFSYAVKLVNEEVNK